MRTKSLTIKTIKLYRYTILAIAGSIILWLVIYRVLNNELFGAVLFLGLYGFYFYRILSGLKLIKEISYDEHSIYVKEKDFEIEIPMYRIKEVTLVSIDGVYKFTLIDSDQFGETVFCKPSVWYPFSHRRVDEELRQLRKKIDKVKEEYWLARQNEADLQLPGMSI